MVVCGRASPQALPEMVLRGAVMPIDEVKKVCFVGAGTMGCYNSLISSLARYEVTLYDVSEQALENAPQNHLSWALALSERGIANQKDIEAASARIIRTTDPKEAAHEADLLSESVFERLDLKRETHRMFEELLPPHATMTTNTSTLLLSDIESAVMRGDKFAAMHFHQPTPLVDLVAGPRTASETMDIIKRFVKSQGQVYVELKKEREGYLHNDMFGALLSTAITLAVLLNVDFREVDRAWMLNQNSEVGPFVMLDYVGLNLVVDIFDNKSQEEDAASPEIQDAIRNFLQPYIERGDLGVKTGKGFYNYLEPEFMEPEFLAGIEENKDLSGPMINAVLASALALAAEGYADLEDIDRSWMLTHNPECGPFGTIDAIGLDVVVKDLEERAAFIEALLGNPGTVTEATKIATDFLEAYIKKGDLGEKSGQGFYSYPDPAYKNPDFLNPV
jgi:3-hydroxybutyryl-CoA dehydrogenase